MAGRRSPVLRDQWRNANDTIDHGGQRPRESRPYRDRGRERHRVRERPPRPKDSGSNRSQRSPPPSRAFPHPGRQGPHVHRDLPFNTSSARGSPGPSPGGFKESRMNSRRFSQSSDYPDSRPWEASERDFRRDESPSAPPSKRKRTRSPSPRRPPHRPSRSHHHGRHPRPPPKRGEGFDRGFPFPKRGRFPGRGRPGRGRGRDRRRNDFRRVGSPLPRDSLSPVRGRDSFSPREWSRSPHPEDRSERDFRHRSTSRHSTQSRDSRYSASSRRDFRSDTEMNSARPMGSPSPLRPVPNFDGDNASASGDGDASARDAFPPHGMNPRSRPSWAHVDTRQDSRSPQYMASGNSYQGSPRSAYSGRGGWGGHHGQQG